MRLFDWHPGEVPRGLSADAWGVQTGWEGLWESLFPTASPGSGLQAWVTEQQSQSLEKAQRMAQAVAAALCCGS